MTKYNIGLTYPGTCEQAFKLYRSVFGGEFTAFIRMKDDPYTDATTALADKEKIAYVEYPLGDILLYGDDTLESSGIKLVSGNNMSISIDVDNKEEADKIYKALSSGGKKVMKMADYPWGYSGAVIDKYGVKWGVWFKTPGE